MPDVKKAIIIGGGPSGLSAALRLQHKNQIQCTVYELRPELVTIGGAIGIPSNGLRLLDRLGVYDTLTQRASLDQDLVQHSINGSILGEANWASWVQQQTGYGYMRVRRRVLVETLLEAVHKSCIPVHYGKQLVKIQETDDHVLVTFSDGMTDTADLLIGADGIHSGVRKLWVDPEPDPKYTGFSSFFSIVPVSSLPEGLVPRPAMHSIFTPEGLFAVIPCSAANDEMFWFFSQEMPVPDSEDSRDGWEVRRKEEVANFQSILFTILKDVKGEWGETLRAIVKNTETVQFYPVFRLPEGGKWTMGRCILIGDAAHALPPHASQGVSLALEDVWALSQVLEDQGASLQEAWKRYEGVRRPRVVEVGKKAVMNRNVRKRTGPWGLWMKENMVMLGLWAYNWLGLGRWGLGQNILSYDIEKEEF